MRLAEKHVTSHNNLERILPLAARQRGFVRFGRYPRSQLLHVRHIQAVKKFRERQVFRAVGVRRAKNFFKLLRCKGSLSAALIYESE